MYTDEGEQSVGKTKFNFFSIQFMSCLTTQHTPFLDCNSLFILHVQFNSDEMLRKLFSRTFKCSALIVSKFKQNRNLKTHKAKE